MVSFSRWQLAAALLEYDNDTENPDTPKRNAYDSAIFAPLRKVNANIRDLKQPPPPQSPNLLGVKLPSESGLTSEVGGDARSRRRSKTSVDLLHNPFGEDEEEEQEEEGLEVDLASWGLDSLMPNEKPSKRSRGGKGKAKSEAAANTVGVGPRPSAGRPAHNRTMSMPLAEFGEGGVFLEAGGRRNTISDPVNLAEFGLVGHSGERQRFSSHPIIENLPARPPLHSFSSYEQERDTVPFPTSSPSDVNALVDSRPASRLNLLSEEEQNPFSIPPPPPSRASRFDPKSVAHARTMSNATRLSVAPQLGNNDEAQTGYSHRAPSRASLLDVEAARDRRLSAASFGTRDMLDDDFQSAYGGEEYPPRERRYSRLDLMRPKVLVMPSPLQTQSMAPKPVSKAARTGDGFLDSTDRRPLPPGARASRMSMLVPSSVPVPANSFTPNPRLSLSASQLLFRNQLMVDGQRDVSYNDIDGGLERAKEDGEQIQLPEEPEEPEMPAKPIGPSLEEEAKRLRPPGKLFGRSLIDDIEARKQEMRSKQRVFKGDQRPSMMDRGALNRSSTLIDPSTLNARPTTSRMPSAQTDTTLARRGSRNSKPLLAIDDNGQIAETSDAREMRMTQAKSVFGVDKLWEREMEKLKEIEAQEKLEQEERNRRIEEQERKWAEKEERKKARKGKKKKGKDLGVELTPSPSSEAVSSSISPQKEAGPSLALPDIPTVTSRKRAAPPPDDFDSDNESSASEAAGNPGAALREGLVDKWVSDDEGKKPTPAPSAGFDKPRINLSFDDDSDEDVPLSVTLQKATQKLHSPRSQLVDDSDEDRPLSMILLNKPSLASFKISPGSGSEPAIKSPENDRSASAVAADDDDDDDNVPLGVRASRLPAGASQISGLSGISSLSITGDGKNNDDDDRPLSMHPAQIRKSQFQMLAQVQQVQQRQQLLQAQMTNSMMFSHPQSMMFMMPPAAAVPPVYPQAPPPAQDSNKFNSVDRWRRDVAVEQN